MILAVRITVPFRQMCLTMNIDMLSIVNDICRKGTVIHANGPRYRWIYAYEGEKRFPETEDSFEGNSNTPKATTAYTDYELNSQGDWTKRKQTRKETPGRTTVSVRYRNIEYYPAKN
jgi:hypothetical protein